MNTLEPTAHSKQDIWATLGAVAIIVIGVMAICLPFATSIGLIIILSWVLIFAGIGHLAAALRFKSVGSFAWELILAAVCVYVGLYMRMHPVMGMTTLVLLLAIFFSASAISEFILYFRNRYLPYSGWLLAHAVLDVILFALIWVHWPANSARVIGLFVGVDLIFAGLSRLISGAPFYPTRRSVPA